MKTVLLYFLALINAVAVSWVFAILLVTILVVVTPSESHDGVGYLAIPISGISFLVFAPITFVLINKFKSRLTKVHILLFFLLPFVLLFFVKLF